MQLTSRLQPVPSIAGVLLVLGLILALAVAAVLIGSQRQRLDPFGPAANGRIAFVSEGDIYTANPDGTDPVAVTSGADIDGRPVWSHVGSKVAFLRWSSLAASTADLMVLDIDAGTLVPVAEGAVNVSVPSWSPDDRLPHVLALVNRSRSTLPPPMAPPTREHSSLVARRRRRASRQDGRRLAYTAPTAGGQALFVVNLDGTGRTRLSTAHPSFSPRLLPRRHGICVEPGRVADPVLRRRRGDAAVRPVHGRYRRGVVGTNRHVRPPVASSARRGRRTERGSPTSPPSHPSTGSRWSPRRVDRTRSRPH